LESIALQFFLHFFGYIGTIIENFQLFSGFAVINIFVVLIKIVYVVIEKNWLIIIEVLTAIVSIIFSVILYVTRYDIPFETLA
jgi:hypothetical protein